MPTTQPSRDSVPYCRVGIIRSGLSKVPVMISILGPSMRRKLKGVPQLAQKSRIAIEEERNAAGVPRVQLKSCLAMSAKEANGAPEAFWHIRQWQMLTFKGGALIAKRMAPHWQPPVSRGLLVSLLVVSAFVVSVLMVVRSADRRCLRRRGRLRRRKQTHRRRPFSGWLPVRPDGLPDRYALFRQPEGPSPRRRPARHRACPRSKGTRARRRTPCRPRRAWRDQ